MTSNRPGNPLPADAVTHSPGASPAGARAGDLFEAAVRFQRQGRLHQALALYEQALTKAPQSAQVHHNMGLIHLEQGRWRPATRHLKKALDLQPDLPGAALGLATALRSGGHFAQALAIYRMALEIDAHEAQAHHGMGICQQRLGAPREAESAMRRAVALAPDNARYWFHLAEANLMLQQPEAAIAAYRKAIDLEPGWVSAHYNMAVALRQAERLEEAMVHLERAVAIDPGYARAYPLLFRLAQHACRWNLAQQVSRHMDGMLNTELARGLKTTEPPMTNIRRCADVRTNLRVARSWSEPMHIATASKMAGLTGNPARRPATGQTPRLRVGYLSADFRDHAVAHQIRGLLQNHDRGRFEIHGYALNPDDGTSYREKLASACDRFIDAHALSNQSVARQIRQDGIQILVDMAGHTRGNRLEIAAMRPAPVQVSYLGFLGTTGADFIDYVVADPVVVPHDHAEFYTEKIAWLPHCYQANDNRMPMDSRQFIRKDYNLQDQAFVYCSFNQPYKIDAAVFRLWMRILHQVDHAILWLVERSPLACRNLRRAASRLGIDPERLKFAGFEPLPQNLARLQLADLVLDTLTYNGGATTSNALWAGVPVLTTPGRHWVSRMSASALQALNMPELIARDAAEYENLAVDLARRPSQLAALRRRLQQQRATAPLFDTPRFTRHMERAYSRMWQRHAAGKHPASFRIDP